MHTVLLRALLSFRGVLAHACVLILLPVAVDAQFIERDSLETRTRQARHRAPASIVVLTRAELQDIPAQTLDDVLRSVAIVNLPAQGSLLADPATTTVSLRGLAGNGVLVLLDGIPLHDAFLGTASWRRIPVEQVERVEIVQGAATSLYGMNAVAGVILITSRKPTTDMVEIQGSAGTFLGANANSFRTDRQHNTGRVNLLASKAVNAAARLTLNANFTGSKGAWLEKNGDDSFTQLSATVGSARLDLQPAPHLSAYLQLGASAILPQTLGEATDDFRPPVIRRIDTRSTDATAGITRRKTVGGTLQADAFYSDTRRWRSQRSFLTRFPLGAVGAFAPTERTPTRDGGARATWTRTSLRHPSHVMLGADVRLISSETRVTADSALPLEPESRARASGTTSMAGLFVEGQWSAADRLTVYGGLRADGLRSATWSYVTLTGTQFTLPSQTTGRVSPTVRVSYALLPALVIRAGAYAGANPPAQLASSPISSVGRAPDVVGPERVAGGEIGLDIEVGQLSLFANIFQQNLRDGIATSGTDFVYAQDNGERRRSRGVEVAGEWSPTQSLRIRASHTYLSAFITANPFETPDAEFLPLAGHRDEHVPIHTLAGSIHAGLPGRLRAMFRGRYQSRYTRLPLQSGLSEPAPLAVFDAALFVPLARELELAIRGENVLNRRYGVTSVRQYYGDATPSLLTVGVRLTPMR